MAIELSIEERRRKVVEFLAEQGFMSLSELAQRCGVSESTLRRDVEVLDEQKVIKRTHGGAVYLKDGWQQPLAFAERESTAAPEKCKIAQAVAQLIAPEQTLIINGGTTCFQVARLLAGRRLSVVTNSVPIASVLMGEQETEVTLIGGYLYPRTGVALGDMALRMLENLHADVLVMSCAGLVDGTAYDANQMMVEVERRMIKTAGGVILAVDHNKVGKRAVARLCGLDEIDVIVTDDGVSADQVAMLTSSGARRVVVAGDNGQVTGFSKTKP